MLSPLDFAPKGSWWVPESLGGNGAKVLKIGLSFASKPVWDWLDEEVSSGLEKGVFRGGSSRTFLTLGFLSLLTLCGSLRMEAPLPESLEIFEEASDMADDEHEGECESAGLLGGLESLRELK